MKLHIILEDHRNNTNDPLLLVTLDKEEALDKCMEYVKEHNVGEYCIWDDHHDWEVWYDQFESDKEAYDSACGSNALEIPQWIEYELPFKELSQLQGYIKTLFDLADQHAHEYKQARFRTADFAEKNALSNNESLHTWYKEKLANMIHEF